MKLNSENVWYTALTKHRASIYLSGAGIPVCMHVDLSFTSWVIKVSVPINIIIIIRAVFIHT